MRMFGFSVKSYFILESRLTCIFFFLEVENVTISMSFCIKIVNIQSQIQLFNLCLNVKL